MELAYEAYTDTCTFGLDEAGICMKVVATRGATAETFAIAGRCLGAQYVASLDESVEGLLTPLPKPGTRLLFARTEANGRIVLVRSGPLERFVTREEAVAVPSIPADLPTERDDEPVFALVAAEAPVDPDATAPFARRQSGVCETEAVTRRSPTTVRAFPPPPTRLPHPRKEGIRPRLRHTDRLG